MMHWDVALAGLAGLVVGSVVGVVGAFAWWASQLAKPDVVQKTLRDVYARAHPHWLQATEEDATRICPACGWNEKRGAAARAGLAAEERAAERKTAP